jgi:hypothetical protein
MSVITTIEQLEAIYGEPNEASTIKVAGRITPPYRVLIEKSPSRRWQRAGRKAWIAPRAAICLGSSGFTMRKR